MPSDKRLWALVSGDADPVAYGPVGWVALNGAWRGRVPVAALNFSDNELTMEMEVRPGHRAGRPSVLLLALGAVVRRVDVNGWHRDAGRPRQQTHVQGDPPPNYLRWLEPHEIVPFPTVGPVGGQQYRQVFGSAASVLGVNVQGVDWIDPPEGSPS